MQTLKTLVLFAVVILACSGASGQTDRALVDRFDRAEAAGQYERALEAALTIVERHPESSGWAFRAGRMHARLGQADEAVAQLGRAADLGYTGIASFEQHADLETLRERDDFLAIVDRVRANAAERIRAFREEALAHEPATHVPGSIVAGEKAPLVIALHGTGGNGKQMLGALQKVCDKLGMICVAPDALRPAGDGFSWTYRDEAEWFVTHLIGRAVAEHGADPERVYLVGFSQGANIALVMAQTHADVLGAVVPVCGHYEPNVAGTDGAPAPTYLLTGSRDNWKKTYTAAKSDFEDAGAPVQLRVVSGMGHQMASRRELERALEWCLSQEKP